MSSRLLDIAAQIMVMAIVVSVVLLFIGIGVLVLIHACIVGRAFLRSFGTIMMAERSTETRHGLSRNDLEKLPCYDFKIGEKGNSPIDCAVCLESFQTGDRCRLLPVCNHSFHAQCVDSWLLKTPICPICRTCANNRKDGKVSGDLQSHCGGVVGLDMRENQLVTAGIAVRGDLPTSGASTS